MKVKVHQCPYESCTKKYSSAVNLKRHVDSLHLRLGEFTCHICNRTLSSKQNFREHMWIHTGERPFKCTHCGVTFRQGSQYSHHKKTHMVTCAETQPFRLTSLLTFSTDRFFNPRAESRGEKTDCRETLTLPEFANSLCLKTALMEDVQKAVF